mgnify:CR=1 FL=1
MSNVAVIYEKYKSTSDSFLFELIINLYLLECDYRNIFQIQRKNKKLITKLENIIKYSKFNYKTFESNNYFRLIVYNKTTFNIDKLDKTFGMKFARQLGKFYSCASDDYLQNNYQIMISVQGINTGTPIYIQMCKRNKIIQNIDNILKIFDDIKKILLKLDKNIYVNIQIVSFK